MAWRIPLWSFACKCFWPLVHISTEKIQCTIESVQRKLGEDVGMYDLSTSKEVLYHILVYALVMYMCMCTGVTIGFSVIKRIQVLYGNS